MTGNDSKYVYQTEAKFVKKEEPTYDTSRKISKTDYDKILEASVKSNKSDREIADILKMRNFSDNDIDVILAERKKKRTPELTESELLAEASRLDSSITKKFPKEKIDLINYSSFNDYKNIKAPDLEVSSPNDLFDHLIDNDEEYQNEVKAYDEALTNTDEAIAEELGVLDDFESWKETKRKNEVKDKSTLLTIANPKRYSPSKNASAAYKAVQEEKKRRGMPEQLDTDDPEARKEKIRAKYYEKYGKEYNDIFKTNLMQNLPENLRNDEEFLKDVENTMHWGDVSVDLTGDGKIYNKNILDSSINVAAVSFAEMAVSGLALISGALETTVMATEELGKGLDGLGERIDKRLQYSGDDDLFDVSNKLKEVRDGLEYYRSKEGQRVMGDVDLGEALTGRNQTINENPLVLVNESLTLLAKSAPYMVGAGYFQGASRAAGLTISGSKSLAAMTTSTLGMGALSGSSYYMSVMGQDWFSEMSPAQRVTLATVNGLAEGLGESVSAHIFNRMITPALKGISGEAAKKTFGEFVKATAYSYGTSVSEEAAAEAATALVQTKYELEAQGKQATWERLKEPLMEAVDSAVLMTGGMQTATTAVRAPFEVQNLHIAGKLGLGMDKLRSRAVIKQLSEEYQNAADNKTKGIIGAQLAKALAKEGMRNKQNAEFFERIRQESPEDHAKLMQIADTFQSKVDEWNSMPEGVAKSALGAEIKADFQEKLAVEEKYKGLQSVQSASNMSAEAISIAQKIKQGESLTMEEESFYAENQAEVEQAVSDAGGKELYVPFEMEKEKLQPTIEYDGKEGFLADLINHFETIGEQVFEGFKTTKDAAIKGLQSIEGAVKAIKAVRPDTKVFVHTSAQAFKDATGLNKLTRGYFMKGNEIHFLAPAMVSTTGYHEATHGAFGEVLGNKSFDALFGEIAKMVKQSGIEGVAVGSAIQRFIAGYEAGNRSEEGVTEFIAMLAAGKFDIQIEKGILRKIAEVIGNTLGFEVPIPSRTQGVQIMKDIAASMREGEPIDPNDIEKLRKKKDKGQETDDKAQIIDESENVRPEIFEDGSAVAQADESLINPEAGKAQVITGDAPTFSLQEALKKTEGRVIVITSDNTGIGEVDGKDVMGGIGYSFIEENLRDGVGFASVNKESVGKVKNMVQKVGNGQDVTVLIMQQKPESMLGNFYAADYLAEAISKSIEGNRKKVAQEMASYLLGLTPISRPTKTLLDQNGKKIGEVLDKERQAENKRLVKEFAKGIVDESTKTEAIAEILDKMSFSLRNKIVSSLLPKGYGLDASAFGKGVIGIKKPASKTTSISKSMAENGFSQVDFWKKYSSPETNTDEYIASALNGDWGYIYSGFITNPNLDWGEDFQKNKGVTHPQFNAKLPSKETFKLDGGYQADNALKDLLTYGYNKKKKKYTKPPAGLRQTTSQSIFAGSFQKSTQEAVLDLVSLPEKDPFNQYHKLSSTPEGKAQIIGELGAMAGGRLEENLNLARGMEEAGKSKEAIFFATGWYRGMDNLWRSEIDYGFIKGSVLKQIEDGSIDLSGSYNTTLGEIFDARALYRIYPSLREYNFSIEPISGTTLGLHYPSLRKIVISKNAYFEKSDKGGYRIKRGKSKPSESGKTSYSKDFYGFMNTIYHEIQHAVQSIEGFSDGYDQTRISSDASKSKKRTAKTAMAQLKAVNFITDKLLKGKDFDFQRVVNELRDIIGVTRSEKEFETAYSSTGANPKQVVSFAQSTGDIVEAVKQNEGAFTFLTADSFIEQKENEELYDTILMGTRSWAASSMTEENKATMEEFRANLLKWYNKNKAEFDLMVDMFAFDEKFNPRNYLTGLKQYGSETFRKAIETLGKIGQGAAVNVSRFTEKDYGSFKVKRPAFDIYRENLGESEARLVGNRGITKVKNRAPLFSELYPDVSSEEIWTPPPAKIIDAVKKQNERLAELSKAEKKLDEELMSQMDRDDKEREIEEERSKVRRAIDVLYKKMDEQLDVAPLPAAVAKKRKKDKAQLIEGTQEYDLFKKEFQEELIRNGVENFVEMQGGAYRLFEHLRFKFADKYQPLQNLQKSIEKAQGRVLSSDANFRRAEALMHGKAAEDARQFEEQKLKPLMDKMIEYGVTNEQISEYLYALHARERNEFVKNTVDPANEAGSGMTNEVADAIIKKYEGDKARIDELADMVYEITEASRKMMLDFGLINKAQYDSFGMFENYVPLVGTAVTPTSDLFDFTDTRSSQDMSRGGGIAIFGKEYRQVSGRFSEAQSPLETVISNHLRTISRGRKNEVLQVLLEMVQQNKDAKAWEVFTEENPDMRVRVASRGESVFIEEATGEEYEYELRRRMAGVAMAGNNDYVPVKVKGKTFYIKFNDKRITRTLNDGGVAKTNMLVKALSKASRHFTRVFTSWNPEFIFANFTRDIQTAMYNQMAEQDMELSNISGQDFVLESLRNVPNAIKGVFQYEKGNREGMDSETKAFYEEYLQSGAKTDWFLLKSAEEIEKEMLKYIEKTKPITDEASLREKARAVGVKGTASLAEVAKFVDVANTSIENGIRFGAYIAARKNGVPADQAAEFVKELTINFNRSGELGAVANSLYLFFNASVQGSTRLLRSVVKSKKAQKVAGGMMAFSALLTMMNIAVGGEDEDGIPMYNKIPEYERERFLIIMYGSERGNYFKIPLPYGVSMFFNMGTALSETAFGVSTPAESASFLLNGIVGSFSPISLSKSSDLGGSLLKSATPTVLKPIVELQLNENFFGSPIYKKDFYYSADTPDSQRPTKHAAEWAKTMAVFLNKATGGSDYEKGMVDLSPDTIEYLFTFLSGGTGKFINRTMDTGQKLYKGKAGDIEFNDVPLARQFLGTVRESEAAGRYYETRREILKQKNKAIGALKSGEPMTAEMKQLNRLLNLDKQVQSKVKKLAEAEKRAERIEDPVKRQELLDKLHDKKIAIYQQFNGHYYKMKQK